jgi:hypothetical protein
MVPFQRDLRELGLGTYNLVHEEVHVIFKFRRLPPVAIMYT